MRYLLPCETCSGRAKLDHGLEGFYAVCTRCGLRTSAHDTIAGAVSQWNFRPRQEAAESGGGSVMPARPDDQEPLGADFEAVWDANADNLYES